MTSIKSSSFYCCSSLTSITIPNNVTSIDNNAFCNCSSLTSIIIPAGVTSIGKYAFCNCSSLTNITIPDGVTKISDGAFSSCLNLTSITIPDNVTSIGYSAFKNCNSLTNIIIPDSVTSVGASAFDGCNNLTDITIGSSVKSIGYDAFSYCDNLTNITIPNSVTSIGDYAFSYCDNLTSIIIPDSVTSIDSCAFTYCCNLTDVYYTGSEADWARISIGVYNEYLTNATIHYNCENSNNDNENNSNNSNDGNTASIPISSVHMYDDEYTINVGKQKMLQAYYSPSNATNRNLKWSSSNTKIATVNDAGIVTGKSEGTVTITVKSSNGKSASCTVKIVKENAISFDNFKYDFHNTSVAFGYSDGFKISKERYLQAGYSEPTALLYSIAKKWSGNCFGMSTTSLLFYNNKLNAKRYYNEPYINYPIQFYAPNTDESTATADQQGLIRMRHVIELFQVAEQKYTKNDFYPERNP